MPLDKQSTASATKPITPALSSRFRTAKTPVAPRLATASSPVPSPTVARKDLREQPLSPLSAQNKTSSLNYNITPRSGARVTRISTESPTSPAVTRRLSGGSSIQGTLAAARQTNTVNSPGNAQVYSRLAAKPSSPNISATRRLSGSSDVSKKDEGTTKFFRANDARPASSFQSPKSTLSPRPTPTAFLKGGSPRAVNSAPSSAVHSRNERKDEGFVRANEAHVRAARPPTVIRKHSTASLAAVNTAKSRSPELLRTKSQPAPQLPSNIQRSPSRIIPLTSFKPISPVAQGPSPASAAIISPTSPSVHRRSFGSNGVNVSPVRPMLHKKAASVSSFHPVNTSFVSALANHHAQLAEPKWMPPNVTIPVQPSNLSIPTPDTLSPRSASLASSKTMGTSVTSDTDASEVSKAGLSYPTSNPTDAFSSATQTQPSQNTPLAQAQMNAAHARRERKVLDLEISNSSLLAINKTLEKELRKQSAELRRFRRLSRSGRLSIAPSNRSVSIQSAISLDTLQEQTEDEEEYSEEDDDGSDSEELEEELDGSPNEGSPGTTARARRRARDEQRLLLDLSKHQQLLIDSQKLTQSIKKCLNISEDLIKEGNQALKYKVGIGDVKLGGRVLSVDDLDIDASSQHEEQNISRQGLLSPSIARLALQEVDLWLRDGEMSDEALGFATPDSQRPD